MVLRLAARARGHLKCPKRHALDRGHNEMRQIILPKPRLQIGRQKKRLVAIIRNESRHQTSLAVDPKTGYP